MLVVGVAWMALWPATALAGTAPTGGFVLDGPKLAGDQAVWVSGEPGAPKAVRIATPGGATRTLWTAPHPGECEYVESLTASADYVAFVYSRGTGACGPRGRRQVVVRLTSGAAVAVPDPYPPDPMGGDPCQPMSVALNGSLLAIQRWNCNDDSVAVRDLDTGDEEATAVPREAYDVRFGFAFADPYIAYHEPAPGNPGRIVVFDRVAGVEAYSVALDPWTSDHGLDRDVRRAGPR